MKFSTTLITKYTLVLVMIFSAFTSIAQNFNEFNPDAYYRLTTEWLGDGMSLDVVNDDKDNKLILAKTGAFTGQFWKITSLGNGYFRFTTKFKGDGKSLTVVNNGTTKVLRLKNTTNDDTQAWKINSFGNGYYRFISKSSNNTKSLDVINDGNNNKVQLSKTADYSGQYWRIDKIVSNSNSNIGKQNTLKIGESLKKGTSLVCPNKKYKLKFQDDGNLAFYGANNRYIWDTKTNGKGATCKLQNDGNLVIYDKYNNPVWSSETMSYFDRKYGTKEWKPVKLVVNDAGFCGLKSATGREVWNCTSSSNSNGKANRTGTKTVRIEKTLKAGKSIQRGTIIHSPTNKFKLKFQADGNLAFYGPKQRYIWDAKTSGKGETCILQKDGNLVIYDKNNKAVWSTETMSYFDRKYGTKEWKSVKLVVKENGFCGLKSATGREVWTCGK